MFLLQDACRVVVGIPRVDLERQSRDAGRRDMAAEALRLHLRRALAIVIVEPRLADRHHLRMLRQPHDLLDWNIELLVRVVWMGADRAEHVSVAFGQSDQIGQLADTRRDGDDHADSGPARASDDLVTLGGKLGEIQVTVMVDEHQALPSFVSSGST